MLQQEPKHRNYLSQLYAADDKPAIRLRKANFVVRAVYPRFGVKSFATLKVLVVGIHERGAVIWASAAQSLPEHFYLCVGDREVFLTCARMRANGSLIEVSFSHLEDPEFIKALAGISSPLITLERMRDTAPKSIRSRISEQSRKYSHRG